MRKSTQKRPPSIFSVLQPYRLMVLIMILFALLSSAVNLVLPYLISHAIDTYSAGNYTVRIVVVQFLAASLIIFVLTYLQSLLQTFTSERVARDLRKKISDRISKQSYGYIQGVNPSKILTNLTSDVDSIKLFVAQAVVSMVSSLVMIVGTSVLLIHLNWRLALPVLLIIPMIMITFFIVIKRVRVLFLRSRGVIDRLNRIINESILGAAIIRVLHSQHLEYNKFLDANAESQTIGMSILRLFAVLVPIISFSASLASLAILVLGGKLVIDGGLSMGDFAAFFNYLTLLIFPILIIGFMSNIIAQSSAAFMRISEVLNAEIESSVGQNSNQLNGEVEIRDLVVSYDGKNALNNISLKLSSQSRTAIIGPTAAGKSQLISVLCGLVKPQSGTVLFDGCLLSDYKSDLLNKQIGVVFQDSVVFNMSIRENIAFSDSVSEPDLQRAIDAAELRAFVDSLPDGLHTLVSERGTSLSGGQKQRIMLARALALNPRILLLDDFTARVDSQTEQLILKNIHEFYPQLTILSVTQKIDSIADYDHIVLLMEGDIVAQGTHQFLLDTCPEYIQIYESQQSTNRIIN